MDEKKLNDASELYNSGRYSEAMSIFKLLAEQGNTDAQYFLGCCYRSGSGIKCDLEQGAKWLLKAAEQGDTEAQAVLASLKNDEKIKSSMDCKQSFSLDIKQRCRTRTFCSMVRNRERNFYGERKTDMA